MQNIILSGIQSSGKLHLGNLFGAVLNWVNLQNEYKCYYFIADLHSLTGSLGKYKNIKEYRKNIILNLLAFGIDPEKSVLFIQSQVPEHTQLHLILSMLTPLPWLERNPTYKDKILELKNKDLNNYGFLGYPVLQAADIILYKANKVPVGEDQLPHLELAREIVRRFNNNFGEVFPEPQPLLTRVPKIPGLDGRKMSKSFNNAIYLDDEEETVNKKVMQLITDPQRIHLKDKGHPDICNSFMLHKAFSSDEEMQDLRNQCESASIGCVQCKKNLAQKINSYLAPHHEKREELKKNMSYVEDVIAEGNKLAKEKAQTTIREVYQKVGLEYNGL